MRSRWWVAVAIAGAAVVPASPAAAHTELDFTLPADGTTVGEPVSEITVGFTEPVTLVGNGFEILTPDGVVIEPFPVTDDDMTFRLPLDPPLAGGSVGVRYEVAAEDGHVLEGSFVFDVAAPAPTTPPPTTPPTTPPTSVAAETTLAGSDTVTSGQVTSGSVTIEPATTVAATATSSTVTPSASAGDDSNRNAIIAVAAVVAVLAAGFLVVRSRRHP